MLKKILTSFFVAVLVVAGGTAAYAHWGTSTIVSSEAAPAAPIHTPAVPAPVGNVNAPAATGNQTAPIHDPAAEIAALPVGDLDATEAEALQFMYEEEKLARDVYQALYATWQANTFQNIAASEQMHMDAVYALIARYNLDVPTLPAGQFANADLQTLYNELVARGSQSLAEAFKTGGAIEEIDILDLQQRLGQTDNPDIQQVFTQLMNASGKHLAAFANALAMQTGETYQPQFLNPEDYAQIISTAQNMGQGANGHGTQANGAGHGAQGTGTTTNAGMLTETIHGSVLSYNFGMLAILTDDGQEMSVQLPNPNYVASLGFAPQPGDGLTIIGQQNLDGIFVANTIITDNGQTYELHSAGGPPPWAGGRGGGRNH